MRPKPLTLTRRRLLSTSAAGATAVVFGAACGESDGSSEDDEQPQAGGILRVGSALPLSSGLDPHLEQGAGLGIISRVYGYMLHVDPRDDSVVYDQAQNVEQPDDRTYIFTLREGMQFQDIEPASGSPVTAHDVVSSINRFRNNLVAVGQLFHDTILDEVVAVDDLTVRATTKTPYAWTLSELGNINAGVIIPKALIDADVSQYKFAIGSGPFQVADADPAQRVSITRFDDYYRAPIPYLDGMEWRIFGSTEDALTALVRDDIDVAGGRTRAEVNALADEYSDVDASASPSLAWLALGFRMDRQPVADERVRGAIDLVLDRDALVKDLLAGDGRSVGPINPVLGDGYWSLPDEELQALRGGETTIDERIAAATALLVAANAQGATIALQVADQAPLLAAAEAVKAQVERAGITIRIEKLALLKWYENLQAGAFQATLISHLPYETPDLPMRFYHSGGPQGTGNPFAYADGSVDAAIERAWAEPDRDLRRDALHEAQRTGLRGRHILQLFTGMTFSAAHSRVRNRKPELFGSLAQYNYEQWLDG